MALLLKGGTALIHDDNDSISPIKTDILVHRNRITKIEPSIEPPIGCDILDCTNKIISPGFIDTHHHVWESLFKGLLGDTAFIPYMATKYAATQVFTARDMFWANLAGSLAALDAGTTTTLDHAHMNWSPEHSKQAISGTITSGIRSIFAYSPSLALTSTSPTIKFTSEPLADWVMATCEQLARASPLNNAESRVRLGLGFDWYFLPREVVLDIFNRVRSAGVDIITSHYFRPKNEGSSSLPALLKAYGVLDERIILSHAGGATAEDVKLLREANAFVAVTPTTEQSMNVGPSLSFRTDLPGGVEKCCSLGIDCHSVTSASIVNEMRVGLLSARGVNSTAHQKAGRMPMETFHSVREAYNMGTIQGARALCMDKDIGSIKIGKKADLVVFEALSPAITGAAQQDPVMAIVMHSTVGDIETVIADGQIRKLGGKLLPVKAVNWLDEEKFEELDKVLSWREVADNLLEIQQRFVSRLPEYDIPKIGEAIRDLYQLP